ncbi:methylated-DNA--[protein]-cysteine S-methyltransferase [Gulosibacter faecalis]|jgi:methylated-DNA-[protein]-cysteine S-methyltransferase|uniref:Methylated-DNA--[protein]-cysteine S-methyltransferase n=1 Tax=Gulosibacter faecalis TaxID=272240 RepID=A0ABW5V011_9MICO|nr:methylated-DNA--[protein]-cysteine S-methyltransferase [Gulosibacter faecalis]
MLAAREVDTPLGVVGVEATDAGVARVWLPGSAPLGFGPAPGDAAAEAVLDRAVAELEEYFAGDRRDFDLPIDWAQTADGFAGEVQRAIHEISFGETASYGEVADRLDRPRAARAVGTACAHNPLPIIGGCHRVIRSDGSTGLYGGGEWMKQWLLDHEARLVAVVPERRS